MSSTKLGSILIFASCVLHRSPVFNKLHESFFTRAFFKNQPVNSGFIIRVVDSGTQQQLHDYAYCTCCLLSRQIDLSDACVLCFVLLRYYFCFRLFAKLVASQDMCKTKFGFFLFG